MKNILLIISIILLASCSFDPITDTYEEVTAPDYVNSSKAKTLEIPPDLSEFEASNTYNVPGEATSYKDFNKKQNVQPKLVKVLDDPDGIYLVKSGSLRWLVVNQDVDTLWPFIKQFWEGMGFSFKKMDKRIGVMETAWAKGDQITGSSSAGLGERLDNWLDNLGGKEQAKKFRTRLEKGSQVGTTEIYLSHRSKGTSDEAFQRLMESKKGTYYPSAVYRIEEYKSDDSSSKDNISVDVKTNAQLDFEINAEVLRRLMVYLGMTDFNAEKRIKNPQVIVRAELEKDGGGDFIKLKDKFDRGWRKLSIALDLIGVVIEDKNRSDGIFYVKYENLDLNDVNSEANGGLLDALIFWDDDDDENKKSSKDEERLSVPQPGAAVGRVEQEATSQNTWKFDLWGSDDEDGLAPGEQRYRVRIVKYKEGSKVFIDLPDGTMNDSPAAKSLLKVLYAHLR